MTTSEEHPHAVWPFFLHLRLNYQFLILSGPFLLGGVLSPHVGIVRYILMFLSVHILLFGGTTVYNSYWDKDEGPIGGLEHPPAMQPWMLWAAWIFQALGFVSALWYGTLYAVVYAFAIFFGWVYSSPHTRWKGRPFLSFVAIGILTVVCSLLLGYLSFGGIVLSNILLFATIGATLLVLSMYPFSQLYQIDEDQRRGDTTFAVRYGKAGVRRVFMLLYPLGLLFLVLSLRHISLYASLTLLIAGGIFYVAILYVFSHSSLTYRVIMRTKYLAGSAFSFMMALLLFL